MEIVIGELLAQDWEVEAGEMVPWTMSSEEGAIEAVTCMSFSTKTTTVSTAELSPVVPVTVYVVVEVGLTVTVALLPNPWLHW